MFLTDDQQKALDAAADLPARVTDPQTGQVHVLLPAEDYDWIRGLASDLPEAPRRLDPRNQKGYALLPLALYERVKAFFEEAPLTAAERHHLLREFGRRAGWDDHADSVF